METLDVGMRVGELAARVGVSAHTLRAWEQRYGLLTPARTVGGYRLYGPEDERRVRAVLALRRDGVPTAEAAASVLSGARSQLPPDPGTTAATTAGQRFAEAVLCGLDGIDEAVVDAALDRLLAEVPLATAIDEGLMPLLRDLGCRWQNGDLRIWQEHFVCAILRRRLCALTLPRGHSGPVAVLAAPSGEQHDLPLLMFGALLSRAGWRVRQLGACSPVSEVAETVPGADVIVLAATTEATLESEAADIRTLATRVPVALAGSGATPRVIRLTGATRLPARQGEALGVVAGLVHH